MKMLNKQNAKKSVFHHANYIFITHCLKKIITASKIISKESRYWQRLIVRLIFFLFSLLLCRHANSLHDENQVYLKHTAHRR